MRRVFLPLAVAGVFGVAACSSLNHGTVTGKSFEAAYTYYVNSCVSYGKAGRPQPVTVS